MSICADDKKERHPLPAALRPYNKDLHTPLQRMRGVRCRRIIDGLHTGIKNARCGTIGQNSLSLLLCKNLRAPQICKFFFIIQARLPDFFCFVPG